MSNTRKNNLNFSVDELGSESSLVDIKKYLRELGEFLGEWKWLVTTRPTHILVDRVLETQTKIIQSLASLPPEVHREVPLGYEDESWPEEVHDFVNKACGNNQFPLKCLVPYHDLRVTSEKTSSKKRHEISRLSAVVNSICSTKCIQCIVDIGSGLGYVDRELCQVLDECKIIAIESDEVRCKSADAVNKDQGLDSRIFQLPMKLYSSNISEVTNIINAAANGSSCLIALHACGDLTPTSLSLFLQNPSIQSAVILSCCYHKMASKLDDGKTTFHNFPSSEHLRFLFASGDIDSDLADVTFLRLAAESTKELWASRSPDYFNLHARSVAFRAIVQLYEHQNDVKFTKTKRKAVKASSRQNWKSYVEAWVSNTDAHRRSDDQLIDRNDLQKDLETFISEKEIDQVVKEALAFNTLRNCIQHLVELFVLVDRLLVLKEAGFSRSSLVRVSDPTISPRSIAIVVCR